MTNIHSQGCSCNSNSSCCSPKQEKKRIEIEFLYLDLSVCERCQGTESNLDLAIDEVSSVLESAGYEVLVDKINVTSPELAIKYEFLSSPTIRINGRDIALEFRETPCNDCGDLCGDTVDCRSWIYEGTEYKEPPKEMIVNAILQEIYGGYSSSQRAEQEYVLPQNLKTFFNGLAIENKG